MTAFEEGDRVVPDARKGIVGKWGKQDYYVVEYFLGSSSHRLVKDDEGFAWFANGGEVTFKLWSPDPVVCSKPTLAFPDYDHYFRLLTDAQRYKLRINAHKGDLGEKPLDELIGLMTREVDELREAVARESEIEIILECADIMNFALGCAISAIRKMNSK